MNRVTKNGWVLLLLLLIGIVVGGLLGTLAAQVKFLSFLDYGQNFGINSGAPVVLDLSMIVITFGLEFKLTIASIIGVIIAFVAYKRWI